MGFGCVAPVPGVNAGVAGWSLTITLKKNRQNGVLLDFMIIRSAYRAMKGAAATPLDNATRSPKRVEDFIVEILFC